MAHLFLGYNPEDSVQVLENLITKHGTFDIVDPDNLSDLYDEFIDEFIDCFAIHDGNLVQSYIDNLNKQIPCKLEYVGLPDCEFYFRILNLDYTDSGKFEQLAEYDGKLENILKIIEQANKLFGVAPKIQWVVI